MLFLTLLVLATCAAVAGTGLWIAQRSTTAQIMDHLTAVREARAGAIEDYFADLRLQVKTLAGRPMVARAMKAFGEAFDAAGSEPTPGEAEALRSFYDQEVRPRMARNPGADPQRDLVPDTPAAVALQYAYLAANPNPVGARDLLEDAPDAPEAYRRAHAAFHPVLHDLQQLFGYYDLFLIEPRGLTVAYSVAKKTDFGTSLRDGPYADSGLAKAARLALADEPGVAEQDDAEPSIVAERVYITDFASYLPSYNAPAAFLSARIVRDGDTLGVLVIQASIHQIDAVMTARRRWRETGLGDTGGSYLVGPNGLMRSNSRFLLQTPEAYFAKLRALGESDQTIQRIQDYETTILQQAVETDATRAARAGQTATDVVLDYRGVPVLSAYRPLKLKGLDWVLLAEIDEEEAFRPVRRARNVALAVTALSALLACGLAFVVAGGFARPIRQLVARGGPAGRGRPRYPRRNRSERRARAAGQHVQRYGRPPGGERRRAARKKPGERAVAAEHPASLDRAAAARRGEDDRRQVPGRGGGVRRHRGLHHDGQRHGPHRSGGDPQRAFYALRPRRGRPRDRENQDHR